MPSGEVVWDSYPVKAIQFGVPGSAVLHCEVGLMGELNNCSVVSESPPGWGFGAAALKLAPTFLMTAGLPSQAGHRPTVTLPVNWPKPQAWPTLRGSDFGYLPDPTWLRVPSAAEVAAAYPVSGGGAAGYVDLSCNVTRYNGRLGRCLIRMEDPQGRDFAKAALSLADKFQVAVPEREKKEALGIWTNVRVEFPAPAKSASQAADNASP